MHVEVCRAAPLRSHRAEHEHAPCIRRPERAASGSEEERSMFSKAPLALAVVCASVTFAACGSSDSDNSDAAAGKDSGGGTVSGKKVTIVTVADANPWAAV